MSLVASIYIFGVLGRNDVRILTLISIGVVAGLHQEVGVVVFTDFRIRKLEERRRSRVTFPSLIRLSQVRAGESFR